MCQRQRLTRRVLVASIGTVALAGCSDIGDEPDGTTDDDPNESENDGEGTADADDDSDALQPPG